MRKSKALFETLKGLNMKYRFFFKILSYFLLLLIPLSAVSSIYYFKMKSMNEKEIHSKMQKDIASISSGVDLYLRTIQENHYNLLQDNTVHAYLYKEEAISLEERVRLYDINRVLMRTGSIVFPYVQDVFLYVDDKRVYSGNGTDDFDLFFTKFHPLEKYPASFWRSKMAENKKYELLQPTAYTDGRMVLPVVNKQLVNGEYATVVSLLSLNSINMIFEQNSYINATNYFVFDQQDTLIHSFAADKKAHLQETADQAAAYIKNNEIDLSKGFDFIKLGREEGYLYYEMSDASGWKFVSYTTADQISNPASRLIQFIFIVFLAIFVLTVMLAVWLSIRIYSPIRKLSALIEDLKEEDGQVNHTDGHLESSEVHRIGSGLRQLADGKKYYQSKFQNVSHQYMEQALLQLLKGQYKGETGELEQYLRENYNFEGKTYMCCVVQFHFYDAFYKEIQDVERFNILSKLRNVIAGLIQPHMKAAVMEYNTELYACMMDGAERARLEKVLQGLYDTFSSDIHYYQLLIGAGCVHDSITGARASFDEAFAAIERMFDKAGSHIVYAGEADVKKHYYYSFHDERQLINFLQTGQEEELYEKLHSIMDLNRKQGVSSGVMQQLYAALRSTAVKFAYDKQLILELDQNFTKEAGKHELNKLKSFFSQVLVRNQEKVREESKQEQLAEQIIKYVDEHLTEDLYLERIAEQMDVSAKYISKIFKEKTGTNLTDYIGLNRIKLARKLLVQTNLPIHEIGNQVGIYSRTTFLRTFKKWEGIAPVDYRQMHQGVEKSN
ncbi:helix-turn-helix domain-containing protein [Paenibacillus sp. GXUN7292]|uniref:helix-turn-helix domain-containing protein n=1 Tax=Paenibacillus sp. GXUN7292 TaxID=3422499 RepID=UPI003D7DB4A5